MRRTGRRATRTRLIRVTASEVVEVWGDLAATAGAVRDVFGD